MPASAEAARRKYSRLKALNSENSKARGWALDVLNVVRRLGKEQFLLRELYARESELRALHPGNQHVRPKIRQQMQCLRDLGLIEFGSPGEYRLKRAQATN
jgi:hypothetical protein